MDVIEGIQRIRHADQSLIIQKINSPDEGTDIPTKRFKANNCDEVDTSDIAATIAIQNDDYYRIYDAMNEKNRAVKQRQKKALLQGILDLNNQAKPYIKSSTTVVSGLQTNFRFLKTSYNLFRHSFSST